MSTFSALLETAEDHPRRQIPPEKLARMHITNKYGWYTIVVTIIFLILFPYWNRWYSRMYVPSSSISRKLKSNLLRYRIFRINPLTFQTIAFWSVVLSLLTFLQTDNWNLNWIAARLGRVCVYCLPTVFFLTLRPSPLPDTLYLAILPVHKWLARLIVLQGLLHAAYYIIGNIMLNHPEKIFHLANALGVVATIAFIIIIITSVSKVRRAAFNVFYINHYTCSWILVITLHGHSRPAIPLVTILNASILLYQIYMRFALSNITWINAYNVSKNMTIVEIPNDGIKKKSNIPGCHIRIIEYDEGNPFKLLWKLLIAPVQHPYTIASLPADETQKLVIKNGKFKLDSTKKYMITGLYLPFLKFLKPLPRSPIQSLSFHTKVKKCLLVAGGSAIAFVLPIARVLNYNGAMVKILWVIRDHEDLKVLDFFKKAIVSDDMMDIFITGNYTNREKMQFQDVLTGLRKKRKQKEQFQESNMLTGNYSTYDTQNEYTGNDSNEMEIDFNKIQSDFNALSESTPLRPKVSTSTVLNNYGSVGTPTKNKVSDTEELNTGFQFIPPKKRRSYVDIRAHHNLGEYDGNDQEENLQIDFELNVPGKYDQQLKRAKEVSSNNLFSQNAAFSDSFKGKSMFKPKFLASPLSISTSASSPPPNVSNDSNSFASTVSSSLYDNLLNYWILENTSCKIVFGRPKLGLDYYSWCIGSSCIGPVIDPITGEVLCFNQEIDFNVNTKDPHLKELYTNETFLANQNARIKERGGRPDDTTWVVASGPEGLVGSTRLWANDCGFNFHEESFSV